MDIQEKLSLLRRDLNRVIRGKLEAVEYLPMTMVSGGQIVCRTTAGVTRTPGSSRCRVSTARSSS